MRTGRPSIYSKEEIEYIKNNYDKMSYKELTENINKFAKIKKDEKQIRTKSALMGFRKQDVGLIEDYFDIIDTEEKAYWLGFIYADGYIVYSNNEVSIELTKSDEKHLLKFKKCINTKRDISYKHKHIIIANNKEYSDVDTCCLRLYSKHLRSGLIKNGIDIRKTYSNTFPKVDMEYFYPFLRGYLDGDGCIYTVGSKIVAIHFTSYSDNMFKYISDILLKDGIRAKIYKETEHKYRLYIMGSQKDKIEFLNKIYHNSSVYLDRKYNIYKNCLDI